MRRSTVVVLCQEVNPGDGREKIDQTIRGSTGKHDKRNDSSVVPVGH